MEEKKRYWGSGWWSSKRKKVEVDKEENKEE